MREEFATHGSGRCIGWEDLGEIEGHTASILEPTTRRRIEDAARQRARILGSAQSLDGIETLLTATATPTSVEAPSPTVQRVREMSRKARKVLRALPHRRGRRALRHGVVATGVHQPILGELQPRTVLDVGANRGQFSLDVRTACRDAHIVSFEPYEPAASVFEQVFRDDQNVRLVRAALGNVPGTATLHISGKDDSSSLLPILDRQEQIFPGTAEVGTVDVDVIRLSDAVKWEELPSPAMLKIDVQGGEMDVLLGAAPLLDTIEWVYVECSFEELYRGQASAQSIIDFLAGHGFTRHRRVVTHRHRGTPVQADILFSKPAP